MTTTEPAHLNGSHALYHGSVSDLHGPVVVESSRVGPDGKYRYVLVYGKKMHESLINVREESFTVEPAWLVAYDMGIVDGYKVGREDGYLEGYDAGYDYALYSQKAKDAESE